MSKGATSATAAVCGVRQLQPALGAHAAGWSRYLIGQPYGQPGCRAVQRRVFCMECSEWSAAWCRRG